MSIKRDYKTESGRSRRRIRLHGFLVILLVLVGLFGALLAYISGDTPRRVETTPTAKPDNEREAPDDNRTPPAAKPKYDFYEVLPERKIVIPQDETSRRVPKDAPRTASPRETNARSAAARTPATRQPDSYIVQAGAFHSYTDADRRKATIAFLGIPARIEKGVGSDGRVLHRIRIGPLRGGDEVKRLRQRLTENDIQSVAIKVR